MTIAHTPPAQAVLGEGVALALSDGLRTDRAGIPRQAAEPARPALLVPAAGHLQQFLAPLRGEP
ncbi:hypothetical protein K7B06_19875 [Streptomyces erythrochromogenes]|nr:hypothetical protein [Streptomyces erythrochromogenes]